MGHHRKLGCNPSVPLVPIGNWTFGLAAVICLIHDLFFTLGAIAIGHYLHGNILGTILLIDDFKLDLPAIAALLTLVGYSVNDTHRRLRPYSRSSR